MDSTDIGCKPRSDDISLTKAKEFLIASLTPQFH